jgi:serine/threonine-protein kinase PknG
VTTCEQPGCGGTIQDGYCDRCGLAPKRVETASAPASTLPAGTRALGGGPAGTRRTTSRRSTRTTSRLGAGLVEVPPMPYRDPATAVMEDPSVAESRRFCGRCGEPVGRSREGAPGRSEGFCRHCGAPFSFTPKLRPGDLVAGQYEITGCLAHGGMGWVYLARDRNVSDRWVVLKGLLNAGDDDAMAAALAERRFLAEVEHPNIVKIFNFVEHAGSGYIVMEYVGGVSLREILVERRRANEGRSDPLPVSQAIAYVLEILPAFGYLHRAGLLYCDFKLDNVIQTEHSLKLIDLGGVYRTGDTSSPIYGTIGYQAPEIADAGPSVPSDLFTVGRTLALLCFDFRGYQSAHRFTLPAPDEVPLFARFDSLYRVLLKATAPNPDDRFQSAEELADQLVGVLREVVAAESGTPVPGASTQFTGDFRGRPAAPDWRTLPALRVHADDPAAGYLATIAAAAPAELVSLLRAAPEETVEVRLRLARALLDAGDPAAGEPAIAAVEADDPWEWRAAWWRGVAALAGGRPEEALERFTAVYHAVPGELAAKLALGVAAETAGDPATAARWYDVVSRTDPAFTTASFGLARCRRAAGDRAGALAAYDRVPDSSSSHLDARLARIALLAEGDAPADLDAAAATLEDLDVDAEQRARLSVSILESALAQVAGDGAAADPDRRILGCPATERDLRVALEGGYRALARVASDHARRIELVDRANGVRPRTWT